MPLYYIFCSFVASQWFPLNFKLSIRIKKNCVWVNRALRQQLIELRGDELFAIPRRRGRSTAAKAKAADPDLKRKAVVAKKKLEESNDKRAKRLKNRSSGGNGRGEGNDDRGGANDGNDDNVFKPESDRSVRLV